ncbi:prolipoprotein diacylglyceryl transferase [Petroclostridium sp. X23]|uniref:prolipoprotein diacylglyceryl transferase n=1 Tax=Petroclostridium sp. X23 TaxID=3045146 RepID=UPI0024ADC89E|nr:prolipoprotein diacylglyceryl transferase [Petroclostridium sp. X23]WHH60160.1 prolipoprotein diacylglyceryl transferase [Petroclostridium sp. X23]
MKVLFYVFGFPVHFFGLMIAVGMLAGIYVAYIEAKRKGLNVDKLFDIVLYSVIAGIVGARVFYIVFYNFGYYIKNPIEVIKINEGGLSIHGGLLAAFIVSFLYIKKHKLNFFRYADAIAPAVILGQGIGRVGCDVFGKVMTTPLSWGIEYQGQLLHPAQMYEFVLDYLVFFILWRMRKSVKYDGQIFLWYVILFSINRGIVELFRINPSVIGWFSISHLLSLLFIIGTLVVMHFLKKNASVSTSNDSIITTESKVNIAKDVFIFLVLVAVSMIIFYTVQS